jgi:hypothetical protein
MSFILRCGVITPGDVVPVSVPGLVLPDKEEFEADPWRSERLIMPESTPFVDASFAFRSVIRSTSLQRGGHGVGQLEPV